MWSDNMIKTLIIGITKTLIFLGNLMGRGSDLPGVIALKLYPNIIKELTLPEIKIGVTGSTGKTSVANGLAIVLKNLGVSVTINSKGSNLDSGIVTALIAKSNLKGNIDTKYLVLEIDEKYLKLLSKQIVLDYLVITNIARDQLTRTGHHDLVLDEIKQGVHSSTHLILNADDPLITYYFSQGKQKISYFGISENFNSFSPNKFNVDIYYCPQCTSKLNFDYFLAQNAGKYSCLSCSFERPNPDYEVTKIAPAHFFINELKIKTNFLSLFNIYNLTTIYSVCNILKFENKEIIKNLNALSLNIKRFEELNLNNRKVVVLSSKSQNPLSFNHSINYLNKHKQKKVIILGFKKVSNRVIHHRDLSWLWDIEFDRIDLENVEKIICFGPYRYDLATRLYFNGIEEKKIITKKNIKESLEEVLVLKSKIVYALVTFKTDDLLKKEIRKM